MRARAKSGSEITAVEGPSVLGRLGLRIDDTCMGHAGPWVSPPVVSPAPEWEGAEATPIDQETVTLTGADLYRFHCQPCHKADGAGLPPVIPSLMGPIRSTSSATLAAQLRTRGIEVDPATVREMSSQAELALRDRLSRGGERMPSFGQLEPAEVDAILAYVKLLAGVAGSESRPVRLVEPALRVGEHVVKGTCRICHDATGPGRDEAIEISMMRGVVPSLASIPAQRTKAEVVRKVQVGLVEPLPDMVHGRMPVLSYLTREEVGAVYEYLKAFTPRP
jgi:mono/diheme cytochrome c family protein